jgi:CYTH domain-containing protein
MKNEIERKFFVARMPDLSGLVPLRYERYFLERSGGVEVRVQRVGERYVYERKENISALERSREKREISRQEFEVFIKGCGESIIRDKYVVPGGSGVAIQVYHGRFEGLVRAEVEFETVVEAEAFVPLDWMGREMTGLPIARDASLLDMGEGEFRRMMGEFLFKKGAGGA